MYEHIENLQEMVKAQHEELVKQLEEASTTCYKPALMVVVSVIAPYVQGFFTFDENEKIIESVLIESGDDGNVRIIGNWGL